MTQFDVTKYGYRMEVSIELLFDQPRNPVIIRGAFMAGRYQPPIVLYPGWPMWLRKEFLKRGHGLGRITPQRARLP